MSNLVKTSLKSSWTPLNNEQANQKWKDFPTAKIFEERRALVIKWFEKWTDGQRKLVLGDLLDMCKMRQIQFAGDIVNKKKPVSHDDFTRGLPRVISLYIFSFLDPRSLCRCSQVCWFWKYLGELDQLWMPKCLKLGWVLTFSPTPYEAGVWKRLYIENIVALKCLTPKVSKHPDNTNVALTERSERPDSQNSKYTPRKSTATNGRKPWRGTDPVPKDTWTNNVLDNDDESKKIIQMRKKGLYGKESQDMTRRATTKVNANTQPPKRPSSVPRSRSVPGGLHDLYPGAAQRPEWAKTTIIGSAEHSKFLNKSHSGDVDPRATLNGTNMQMKTVKLGGKPHRTPRDPPSSNLFPEQPWKVPDDDEYDSEVY